MRKAEPCLKHAIARKSHGQFLFDLCYKTSVVPNIYIHLRLCCAFEADKRADVWCVYMYSSPGFHPLIGKQQEDFARRNGKNGLLESAAVIIVMIINAWNLLYQCTWLTPPPSGASVESE